jgi:hypothetical protein
VGTRKTRSNLDADNLRHTEHFRKISQPRSIPVPASPIAAHAHKPPITIHGENHPAIFSQFFCQTFDMMLIFYFIA